MFMIGIDPHKGSHTAAAVDRSESVIATLRVEADRDQRQHLLDWAASFEPRTWAVEGATGMGALLAQQLVAAGERVVDVPPKLSARVRLLDNGRIDKTDPNDARSAAVVAWRTPTLNEVIGVDEHRVVLRLLADRDHQTTAQRTRTICRLHALLCLVIEGGATRSLTVDRAEKMLATVIAGDPVSRARVVAAGEFLERDQRTRRSPQRRPPAHRRSRQSVSIDGHRRLRDRANDGRDHHRPHRRRAPLPDRRALRQTQRHRPDRSIVGAEQAAPVEPAR